MFQGGDWKDGGTTAPENSGKSTLTCSFSKDQKSTDQKRRWTPKSSTV
jgi:hypothetical protein